MRTPPTNAITAIIILGRRDVVLGDDEDNISPLLLPFPTIPLPRRVIGGVGDDDFFC